MVGQFENPKSEVVTSYGQGDDAVDNPDGGRCTGWFGRQLAGNRFE